LSKEKDSFSHRSKSSLLTLFIAVLTIEEPCTNKQLKMVDCSNAEISDQFLLSQECVCKAIDELDWWVLLKMLEMEEEAVNHIAVSIVKLFVCAATRSTSSLLSVTCPTML
jgi:hypothetical protein